MNSATSPNQAQITAAMQSHRDRVLSAKCMLHVFDVFGVPESMIDVGCGFGHLVRIAQELGPTHAVGLDITSEDIQRQCYRCDLERGAELIRDPVWSPVLDFKYDLSLCLEVAEHLSASSSEALCDLLAHVTGKRLIFSAAVPGQGGSGHINEQPHEYWIEMLEKRGFRHAPVMSKKLRRDWLAMVPGAPWYGNNVMVFEVAT